MQTQEVQQLIEKGLPGSQVTVQSEGSHYLVEVVSETFSSLNKVKRQQAVYACINEAIASGAIHAVTIRAYSPEESKEA